MSYRVEMDVFSGMENPSWSLSDGEASELQDRVLADPESISDVTATDGRLGYKGYIVSAFDEPVEGSDRKLPSRFRVGAPSDTRRDIAEFLLKSTEKANSEVDDWLREYAKDEISRMSVQSRPDSLTTASALGTSPQCASNWVTSSTDFTFWNASPYIDRNNCYNFASNYRSNTFAQPGRKSGRTFVYTGSSMAAALHGDSWNDSCSGAINLDVALVIWPGKDFHFYRMCGGNHWCHKPGHTPARNTDDSGRLITNPQYCNRGPYTMFVGFMHVGNSYVVVQ